MKFYARFQDQVIADRALIAEHVARGGRPAWATARLFIPPSSCTVLILVTSRLLAAGTVLPRHGDGPHARCFALVIGRGRGSSFSRKGRRRT